MAEFLLAHHPDIKRTLCALALNNEFVFSEIDKQLFAESRAQNNSPIRDTLDYELNRINTLHGLLVLDQENTDRLRNVPPSPKEIQRGTLNRLPIPTPSEESSKNDRRPSIPHQSILANLAQIREESHRRLDEANKTTYQDLSAGFKEFSNTVEREFNDD